MNKMNYMMLSNTVINAPNRNYPNRSFILENMLGEGGEGCVFLGNAQNWDNKIKGKIAIKLQLNIRQDEIKFIEQLISIQVNYEQASNPQVLNFKEQAASKIIRIYEIFKWNDYYVIVMELGGENLYEFQKLQKNLSIVDKLIIMKQITQGISFLHSNGLIHRDIKPENFIRVGNYFKLIDFGLIRQDVNDAVKSKQVGTPIFQSPELYENSTNYTQAIDIWSLACVFYEIIEGQPLLTGKDYNEVKTNVLKHRHQPQIMYDRIEKLNVSSEIKQLLTRMLAYNSDQRPSAKEILDQLNKIQMQQSILENQKSRENPRVQNQLIGVNQQIPKEFVNNANSKSSLPPQIQKGTSDQTFLNQKNQNNQQQQFPNQIFQPASSQIDIQGQLKSGFFQIQTILQNQLQKLQEQYTNLIDQNKSLIEQNKNLMDQTIKNQQQIQTLQQELYEQKKNNNNQLATNTKNIRKEDFDQQVQEMLLQIQNLIQNNFTKNFESINKLNASNSEFLKYIKDIPDNFDSIFKLNNKLWEDQNIILKEIQLSEKQNQQWFSELKQHIQTDYSQIQKTKNNESQIITFNDSSSNIIDLFQFNDSFKSLDNGLKKISLHLENIKIFMRANFEKWDRLLQEGTCQIIQKNSNESIQNQQQRRIRESNTIKQNNQFSNKQEHQNQY